MNAARVSSPRATRARRASQVPVSSGEARLFSGSASMSPMPMSVGTRFFPSRATKVRRISVSIVAARVAGVPRPESRMAARSSSSEISRPADSIAPSSVASVWRGGGRVCLVRTSSLPSRRCPSASGGSVGPPSPSATSPPFPRSPRARAADLGDVLPAGDEPHPSARAVAIGRRRQRRHQRFVGARRRRPAVRPRRAAGVPRTSDGPTRMTTSVSANSASG